MIPEIESGELECTPIKLTDEWLVAFGFKTEDNTDIRMMIINLNLFHVV
jgi:hypothetical protein